MIVTRIANGEQDGPHGRHAIPSRGGYRKPGSRAWPRCIFEQIDDQDIDQSDYYNDYQQREWDSPCGNNKLTVLVPPCSL
jgi:hypothetical protein